MDRLKAVVSQGRRLRGPLRSPSRSSRYRSTKWSRHSLEALGLVVLVVFLFLQSWRATLIPILAIPVSIIGTFAFFIPLGFTINTLTMFGFVLAIGIVVDDAIIVVEAANIISTGRYCAAGGRIARP